MKMGTQDKGGYRGRWYLVLAACVVTALVLLPLITGGCDSGAVKTLVTGASSDSVSWTGNGSDNIDGCQTGLHWILTPAGSGSLVSATLYVDFGSGYVSYAGYQPGGNGAFHFDSAAGAVSAAYADYTYDGDINTGNVVLTISHCNDEATTTTEGETTTTEVVTSTTVGQVTSTTVGQVTSTTGQTTTTEAGTTTTAGATTTTAVGQLTSTTALETTTTAAEETTTTAVGGLTSTTVQNLTTAGRIDTGGGGTAGGGPNVMLWLIVSLLGALAVALGSTAIWSGLKQKSDR